MSLSPLWRAVGLACLTSYGCVTFTPTPSSGPCRDSAGRFAVCPTSGDGSAALILLGIAAAVGVVAGIGYLVSSATRPSSAPDPLPPPQGNESCGLHVTAVNICESVRGYRFALPSTSPCPLDSALVREQPITCDVLNHPAYHACINTTGGWRPVHSWVNCADIGMQDAPGGFVPPGREPSQGVGPDAPSVGDR